MKVVRRGWTRKLIPFYAMLAFTMLGSTPGPAEADVAYTYTSAPFNVAACVQQYAGTDDQCPSGNVTATVTFGAELTPGFTGALPGKSLTVHALGYTVNWPNDFPASVSPPGNFEFINGVLADSGWIIDIDLPVGGSPTGELKITSEYFTPIRVCTSGICDSAYFVQAIPTLSVTAGESTSQGTWSLGAPGLTSSSASLGSSVNPSVSGESVTFTATVSGASGTPTGSVTFMAGSAVIGSAGLLNGIASVTTSSLSIGSDTITANYGGDANFSPSVSTPLIQVVTGSPPVVVASVLPGSRSVQVGTPATVFALMLNGGSTSLDNCEAALPASAPAGLTMSYQTTDPGTNALTGSPNTPVTIAGNGGFQTFVLTFQSTEALSVADLPLDFDCAGSSPATSVPGVDTVDLIISSTPVTDIIALSATPTNDGTVAVPNGGAAAFAVASINAGVAGQITASADTGSATLPVGLSICQSDPSDGQCLAPPATTTSLDFSAGGTPTFSIFLQATGTIPLSPGTSRVFVRFKDGSGGLHGSTSVAVYTP